MACLWAFVGLNWVPTGGTSLESEQRWIEAFELTSYPTPRLYAISVYVAVSAMFGGVGERSGESTFLTCCSL